MARTSRPVELDSTPINLSSPDSCPNKYQYLSAIAKELNRVSQPLVENRETFAPESFKANFPKLIEDLNFVTDGQMQNKLTELSITLSKEKGLKNSALTNLSLKGIAKDLLADKNRISTVVRFKLGTITKSGAANYENSPNFKVLDEVDKEVNRVGEYISRFEASLS